MTDVKKKQPNRKPTARQARAVKNLVENGGNMGKAIIDAGYAASVAKTPAKVFKSTTLEGMLEEAIPTSRYVKKISDLLDAQTQRGTDNDWIEVNDNSAQIRAADLYAKLRGWITQKHEHKVKPEEVAKENALDAILAELAARAIEGGISG